MPSDPGDTAKILIIIGMVFDLLGIFVFLGLSLLIPFIGGLFFVAGLIGIVFLLLVFIFCYAPTPRGDYEDARTPTLVFAILSLLTVALIPGILYLVAYVKLGDAAEDRTYSRTPPSSPPTWGNPTYGYRAPSAAPAAPLPSDSKFCTRCG